MVLLISLSGCLVTLQNVQFLCECQCWDGKTLIDHLKAHIVEGRPMSCTVTGCKHVWKFKLSFTQMHILFRLQSNNPTESVNYGPKVCKFVEVNIAWISTLRSFRGQHFHFLSESLFTVVDYDFLCSQWCEGHTNWTKEKEDITQTRVSPRVLSPLVQCLSYTYLITDPVPWHHWSAVPLVPTECSNRCNQNVLGSLVGMESKRHKQKSMCEWPEWWGLLRPWPSLVGGGQGGM